MCLQRGAAYIKKTPMSELLDNIRKGGLIALGLREGDELIGVMLSTGDDAFLPCGHAPRQVHPLP